MQLQRTAPSLPGPADATTARASKPHGLDPHRLTCLPPPGRSLLYPPELEKKRGESHRNPSLCRYRRGGEDLAYLVGATAVAVVFVSVRGMGIGSPGSPGARGGREGGRSRVRGQSGGVVEAGADTASHGVEKVSGLGALLGRPILSITENNKKVNTVVSWNVPSCCNSNHPKVPGLLFCKKLTGMCHDIL